MKPEAHLGCFDLSVNGRKHPRSLFSATLFRTLKLILAKLKLGQLLACFGVLCSDRGLLVAEFAE